MDSITEILPNLFVGGYGGAMNEELLEKNKISIIITLDFKLELPHKNNYEYYLFDMKDDKYFNIEKYFEEILNIIHCNINNKKILIHCYCGASRSVSICIAYLIKHKKLSFVQSYEFIRKKRNIIEPNDGFIEKIIKYYNQSSEDYEIYKEYLKIINIIEAIKYENNNQIAVSFYEKKLNIIAKKLNLI